MEKQVEWVRAERDEAAANAAAEARELGARVKEGEAALTRLKAPFNYPLHMHCAASCPEACFSQHRHLPRHNSGCCQLPGGRRQRQLTGVLADGVW